MKKYLIILVLFVIALSKKCGPLEIWNEETQKCDCRYAQDIKTRKCVPPKRYHCHGMRCRPYYPKRNWTIKKPIYDKYKRMDNFEIKRDFDYKRK